MLQLLTRYYPALLMVGLCSSSAWAEKVSFNDWIEDPHYLCGGHYKPPTLLEGTSNFNGPLEISADQSRLSLDGESLLMGNVVITQGSRQIHADEALIVHRPHSRSITSITATGQVRFNQPGIQIIGEEGFADRETGIIDINDASYHMYARHARGESAHIQIDNQRVSTLSPATYTTCAPGDNTWALKSKKTILDPDSGRGTAIGTWLTIKDTPVAYLPYVNFPLDKRRQTGFLYGSIGSSTASGSVFELPLYINLAPNYDALLTFKYLSLRGAGVDTQVRYLTESSQGDFQLDFLANDNAYQTFRHEKRRNHPTITNLSDPRLASLHGMQRAAIRWKHSSSLSPNWALDVNYNAVSDDNYYVDLDEHVYGNSAAEQLQEVKLSYSDAYWESFARFQEYQVLHPFEGPSRSEIYRRQPQIQLKGNNPLVFSHLGLSVDSEFVRFNIKRDPLTLVTKTYGDRLHLRPAVTFPWQTTGWHIRPRIQWDFTLYDLRRGTIEAKYNRPHYATRNIPMYDLEAGLLLDRYFTFKDTSWLQTLEPKLYYLYVPYRRQDYYPNFDSGPIEFSLDHMFRDNRFSGLDRVGDANQISIGLTSRLLETEDHWERLRGTIGQTYYFKDRRASICDTTLTPGCQLTEDTRSEDTLSPLAGEIFMHLSERLFAVGTLEWNHELNATDKSVGTLEYRSPDSSVFNVAYQYLRIDPARTNLALGQTRDLNQISTSFFKPISEHWRLLGRMFYDRSQHHVIDSLVGLEYDSCCFAAQLVGTRFLRPTSEENVGLPSSVTGLRQYNNAVYLQISLKGLSTFGYHGNDSKLVSLIPGYRPFSQRDFSE